MLPPCTFDIKHAERSRSEPHQIAGNHQDRSDQLDAGNEPGSTPIENHRRGQRFSLRPDLALTGSLDNAMVTLRSYAIRKAFVAGAQAQPIGS